MSSSRSWRLLVAAFSSWSAGRPAPPAQDRIFPNVPELRAARRPRPGCTASSGRLLSARRGDSDSAASPRRKSALGENFPVVALRRGDRARSRSASAPRCTGASAWATGRARSSATTGSSALNTTAALGAWSAHRRAVPREQPSGRRIQRPVRRDPARLDPRGRRGLGHATGPGPLRVTGNLSYVLIDELDLDRPGAALAADYEGRPFGSLPRRSGAAGRRRLLRRRGRRPTGESAPPPSWASRCRAPSGGREIGIALIAHDGLSTQRQFFRRESRYIGGELRFDL